MIILGINTNYYVKNLVMMTINELNIMKNQDFKTCDINSLVDIRDINIDTTKSRQDKLLEFIEKIKNPYFFKVGDIVVKVKFVDDNKSFQEKMENLLLSKIKN